MLVFLWPTSHQRILQYDPLRPLPSITPEKKFPRYGVYTGRYRSISLYVLGYYKQTVIIFFKTLKNLIVGPFFTIFVYFCPNRIFPKKSSCHIRLHWNLWSQAKYQKKLIRIFFNWNSLHARLNSHHVAWNYKKRTTERLKHTGNV